ncbi:MAG: hypothetical protein HY550_05850 [Elusimicrobia bacterium]|nr:hypothetical protein [Elusimicrobiota bacterium]
MNKLILAFSLLAQPLAAAVGEPALELKGYVSAWTQDCSGASCQLPKPGERNRPVTLRLALPASPGEAAAAHAAEKLAVPGAGELPVDINFYAVCPYGGKENCAGRYFQAQVSLSGPAGAFCAAALNTADFAPFPVLMCAGSSSDGRRLGVTLHRLPL